MPRFLVINPNTSEEMTCMIRRTATSCLHSNNHVDVITAETGPESLESYYEYALATVSVIATINKVDLSKYAGVLLACFGDPGLYALKETLPVPLLGIAEASLSVSLLLGSCFAILVAREKAVPMMKNMVQQYGLTNRMAGVFPLGIPVLDLEREPDKTAEVLLKTGSQAVAKGADVLLLGCAGMTGFSEQLERKLGVTVLDPVRTGMKVLECIVESGLNVSKKGLYETPAPKEIKGMPFINR